VPTPGGWSGQNISFNVNADSTAVTDFKVTFSGHSSGMVSYDYTSTHNVGSPIAIADGVFSTGDADFTATGTFADPHNATIEVSWVVRGAWGTVDDSGAQTYTASHP
jgi:NifU-like protein involved in Fe-S cluster formation